MRQSLTRCSAEIIKFNLVCAEGGLFVMHLIVCIDTQQKCMYVLYKIDVSGCRNSAVNLVMSQSLNALLISRGLQS